MVWPWKSRERQGRYLRSLRTKKGRETMQYVSEVYERDDGKLWLSSVFKPAVWVLDRKWVIPFVVRHVLINVSCVSRVFTSSLPSNLLCYFLNKYWILISTVSGNIVNRDFTLIKSLKCIYKYSYFIVDISKLDFEMDF